MLQRLLAPIIESMMPDWPVLDERDRAKAEQAALAHVQAVLRLAPLHIRAGVSVLACGFTAYAWLSGLGRGYRHRGVAWRADFLKRWSRLGPPARSFERLMRSLTLLAALEHPVSRTALGLEAPTVWRRQQRLKRKQISETTDHRTRPA